jgi:hypothetical protein
MDMELARPGALPNLRDLNSLAKSAGHQLVLDLFGAVEDGEDITNYKIGDGEDNTMPYVEVMRDIFFRDDHSEDLEATLTTYRALGFASNLANILLFDDAHTDYGHVPRHLHDDDLAKYISRQAQAYLRERAALDNIIGNFIANVSPEQQYATRARLIVGFQLIAIDRYLQAQYIEKEVAAYQERLTNWGGIIEPPTAT